MKNLLRTLLLLIFVGFMSSCVEDAYEEIEVSDIELNMKSTDDDGDEPNKPGSCGCTGTN
ncbi:MAG: hypothetical protein AAGJ93_00855 [Bacteroidota bacterium]